MSSPLETEAELAALRRSVVRGTPFGGEAWQERTAKRLGLESTLRARGRPRKLPHYKRLFKTPDPFSSSESRSRCQLFDILSFCFDIEVSLNYQTYDSFRYGRNCPYRC